MTLPTYSEVHCFARFGTAGFIWSKMFLALFCIFLAFCCFPEHLATPESSGVFQTPAVITLFQVNSTTELRCTSMSEQPLGLYLKRRYAMKKELLYLNLPNHKETLHYSVRGRLLVTGSCCDFTLRLSQLQLDDTDGYICEWIFLNGIQTIRKQARETVIIIRDRDPEEHCKKHTADHLFIIIAIAMGVSALIICIAALIWKIQAIM